MAVVSDVAGTTTDTVRKAVELPGLGACVLLDTPGFDDTDRQLGRLRIERMQTAVEQADIVIVVASGVDLTEEEREWIVSLRRKGTPWMLALGKADTIADAEQEAERMGRELKVPAVAVSAWKRT